jgi:hypothetical protein
MTDNDMPPSLAPGQWVQVDPQHSAAVLANPQSVPQYMQVAQMRAVEDVPATTGIVLDQKVFFALVLILGAVAGVVLMLILDKYTKGEKTA